MRFWWDAFWCLCACIGFLVVLTLLLSILAVLATMGWIGAIVSFIIAGLAVVAARITKPRRAP